MHADNCETPIASTMSDIFLSYKREDRNRAKALAEALENAGWSVWWDPQLRSGEHFDDVIERELISAKCVVVVWSNRSVRSQYVKDEAAYALKLNKLIPVAIDEVELPFRYQGLQTAMLTGWSGSPSFPEFEKLLADLTSIIGSQRRTARQSSVGFKMPMPVPLAPWVGRNERFVHDGLIKLMHGVGFLFVSLGKPYVQFAHDIKDEPTWLVAEAVSNAYLPKELQFGKIATDRLLSMGYQKPLAQDGNFFRNYVIDAEDQLLDVARTTVRIFREVYVVGQRSNLKIELKL
jgi:hypothetical protein